MNIQYCEYRHSDKEELVELIYGLLIDIAIHNKLRLLKPKKEFPLIYLNKLLNFVDKKQGKLYIALMNEKPIAFIAGQIKKRTKEERLEFIKDKKGYISDLFVKKEYRRLGIGDKLMKLILEYFRIENCGFVVINVLQKNPKAKKLYEKYGFLDHNVNMIRYLRKY